ncbi:MAG: hypothetical protein WA873_02485 [Jannaschia helgolandensis]
MSRFLHTAAILTVTTMATMATMASGASDDAWDNAGVVNWACTFASAPRSAQVRLTVNDESGGLRSGSATVTTSSEEFRLQGALTNDTARFTDGISGPVILTIKRSDGSALLAPVARGTCVLR